MDQYSGLDRYRYKPIGEVVARNRIFTQIDVPIMALDFNTITGADDQTAQYSGEIILIKMINSFVNHRILINPQFFPHHLHQINDF